MGVASSKSANSKTLLLKLKAQALKAHIHPWYCHGDT